MINTWKIPDLALRFLESGSLFDSANNNIFTNYQTLGTIEGVGDQGFTQDATTPSPQPVFYLEQAGTVLRTDWLEGNINVIIKVKSNTRPDIVTDTVPGLGQLINAGTLTIFNRYFTHKYDHFETTTIGGVAPSPLNTESDADNQTGTHRMNVDTAASNFIIGEEITATVSGVERFGVITSITSGASDEIDYVLKSAVNFGDTETITGAVSGAVAIIEGAPTTRVAGFGTNVSIGTIDSNFTGGTTTGTYDVGETVTQTTTNATGILLHDDTVANTLYIAETDALWNGSDIITGDSSTATYNPTTRTTDTTVPKDIEDGAGAQNYNAVVSGDKTGASPQTIEVVYEWLKYETRGESTALHGGPGQAAARIEGRIYRRLIAGYAEKKQSPFATFSGGKAFGARGVYIDKDTLNAADVQDVELIDAAGVTRNPPNLQSITVSALVSGDRVGVYRTATLGAVIQRSEFDVGTVGGGNNQAADSTILVGANDRTVSPLANDVPSTGVLRVLDPNDTGNYLRFPYNAVDRTTNIFTLTSGTIGDVTGAVDLTLDDNVHVVFIEEQSGGTSVSNSVIFDSNIFLKVIVRVKGILPFETSATFVNTGVIIGAVRTPDTVVDLP